MSYHSGVYKHTTGGELGGHAVKIVGWGQQGSTPYWIVANSWGTGWGLNGYFWFGMNQCSFEQQGIAAHAQV
jgi:C1A family cysteine protease